MATLQQLQAMKTDIDAALTGAATDLTAARGRLTTRELLPVPKRSASHYLEVRLAKDYAGHLAYTKMLLETRARFLTAEISRVQLGSTSTAPALTTSAEVTPRKNLQPIGRPYRVLAL